jgi:serine/threonine-protein kinase RsbW
MEPNSKGAADIIHVPAGQSRKPDYQLVIPSALEKLADIEAMTERIAEVYHLSEDDRDNLAIAITELSNNAIIHGNRYEYHKKVIISFYHENDSIRVYIKDEGGGFDPTRVDDPLQPENLMKESGRGIFILKSLMDDVSFNITPKGTEVMILKKIKVA